MAKTVTAALSAHMSLDTTTMVSCWKIVRSDGVVLGFTDHVEDIVVSGLTYEAESGYTPTSLESNAKLSVDNLDIVGGIDSNGITAADIDAKKYDHADVYMFMVNFNDPDSGHLKLTRGNIGNITVQDNTYVAEMRSLTQRLQQTIGEKYSERCRADLGDARCQVPIDASAWASTTLYASGVYASASGSLTGKIFMATVGASTAASAISSTAEPSWNLTVDATTTDGGVNWITKYAYQRQAAVTSVESARVFHSSALVSVVSEMGLTSAVASAYYAGGLVTWLASAANSTYAMEVKTYASGRVELREPMPYAIMTGDVFKIYPGCHKRLTEDCVAKFDNAINFRGEPFVPGLDQIAKIVGPK